MTTLFVTISRGSLIRNFFHTGVVSSLLERGFRVVVLTPNYNEPQLFKRYAHPNLIFEPLIPKPLPSFYRLRLEVLKGAVFGKTVHSMYRFRAVSSVKPKKRYYLPRLILFAPLSFIPSAKRFIRWLDMKLYPQCEHDYLFKKYNPALTFVTTPHVEEEVSVLKGAQRFGSRTASMPKSWDNLSKVLFAVKADRLFVWGEFMKEQAQHFQGYKAHEVEVVGAPQFDYYSHSEHLISREAFCAQFGFDPKKKIILYGSSGVSPEYEAEYVHWIRECMESGKLPESNILVRPHVGYAGDTEPYKKLAQVMSGVVVDETNKQNHAFKDHWDISLQHLSHLYNSLHHADVLTTVASTLTLDAVAVGTPVVNIGFDLRGDIDFHYSVRRFFLPDYAQALTQTGATWFVRSKEEYVAFLGSILREERTVDEEKRAMFIRMFMRSVDGASAERIADSLTALAGPKE